MPWHTSACYVGLYIFILRGLCVLFSRTQPALPAGIALSSGRILEWILIYTWGLGNQFAACARMIG